MQRRYCILGLLWSSSPILPFAFLSPFSQTPARRSHAAGPIPRFGDEGEQGEEEEQQDKNEEDEDDEGGVRSDGDEDGGGGQGSEFEDGFRALEHCERLLPQIVAASCVTRQPNGV